MSGMGAQSVRSMRSGCWTVEVLAVLRANLSRTAAEKFLDSENMLFIVVGKADNIKAGLEKIGKVIVRPFGGE